MSTPTRTSNRAVVSRSPQVTLLLAVLSMLVLSLSASAQSAEQLSNEVFKAINQYRASKGKSQLKPSSALQKAAQQYAAFVAKKDLRKADNWHFLDGRSPLERAKATGFTGNSAWENMQMNGNADPVKAAMKWWKQSPGHNANMLRDGHNLMGIGAAKSPTGLWQFVALFSEGANSTNTTKSNGTGRPSAGSPSTKGKGQFVQYNLKVTNRSNRTIQLTLGTYKHTLKPGYYAMASRTTTERNFQFSYSLIAIDGTARSERVGKLNPNKNYELRKGEKGIVFVVVP